MPRTPRAAKRTAPSWAGRTQQTDSRTPSKTGHRGSRTARGGRYKEDKRIGIMMGDAEIAETTGYGGVVREIGVLCGEMEGR